jgi:hypothetical protein
MPTLVEFKSAAFPKYPNENEELVNDHCWGKRLAEYVRDELPKHGVATGDILCEDWGWLVYLENADFPLFIGCGVMDDGDVDADESDHEAARHAMPPSTLPKLPEGMYEFVVHVNAEPSLLKRLFRKVNTAPAIEKAAQGLKAMMAADPKAFQDVQWSD